VIAVVNNSAGPAGERLCETGIPVFGPQATDGARDFFALYHPYGGDLQEIFINNQIAEPMPQNPAASFRIRDTRESPLLV
jgi:hypothetical protein